MADARMHADEIETPPERVRKLVDSQFPEWAELPLERVASTGTDHAMYRLGAERVVRLPRIPAAAGQVGKEHRWLPFLAPELPLAIPTPLALGKPGAGYPFRWSVYPWLPGVTATRESVGESTEVARSLAAFVRTLGSIDASAGPPPGPDNFHRGVPLAARDALTREAISRLEGEIDTDAATAVWEAALRAPVHRGPPRWIHGDLQAGNLLVRAGRLCAVIDFGGLGVGDPACDLMVAWNLLSARAREGFRAALSVDAATWSRGVGWALSTSLVALPYYEHTHPEFARYCRRTVREIFSESAIE